MTFKDFVRSVLTEAENVTGEEFVRRARRAKIGEGMDDQTVKQRFYRERYAIRKEEQPKPPEPAVPVSHAEHTEPAEDAEYTHVMRLAGLGYQCGGLANLKAVLTFVSDVGGVKPAQRYLTYLRAAEQARLIETPGPNQVGEDRAIVQGVRTEIPGR